MGDRVIFYMWEFVREQLISRHQFYGEQARKRLVSQFEDVSDEADKAAEEWLKEAGQWFDPDRHDPDAFQEQAVEKGLTFFELLTEMHHQTRLSVIAGMYHEWDKQLRDWLSTELEKVDKAFLGGEMKRAIWRVNITDIFDLLESFDWHLRAQPYYVQLDTCRLVVNVYKHGLGSSFAELKKDHPQYLENYLSDELDEDVRDRYLNHTHLKVTDEYMSQFSDAIIAFWKGVPEKVLFSTITNPPNWFNRAWDHDVEKKEPKG
jgi:hypothetical protein